MVSYKKLQNNNGGGGGGGCSPGPNKVSFKDIPPGQVPPVPTPPGPPSSGAEDICSCLGDKLDTIALEIQQTYQSGPSFNAHRPIIPGDPSTDSTKLFTQAATPIAIDGTITGPTPNAVGFYDNIEVATQRGGINTPLLFVIADPDAAVDPNNPFLYVRVSNSGSSTFNQEVSVRVGEDWGFRDVWALRIRATVAGAQYRVTTDPHKTTFVSTIVNIPSPSPAATTAPVANRPNFICENINIPFKNTDQQLPSIAIPNGFALSIRSNIDNSFSSRIYISRTDATIPGDRVTLAPGDVYSINITDSNLVHVAGTLDNLTIDVSVEL